MIGIFFTARLGSTRLKEKHLIEAKGKPFINWLVERFSVAFKEKIDKNEYKLFLTTANSGENKKFESIFKNIDIEIFYGSDENIPLRHLQCANEKDVDLIISIDGDDILCSTEATQLVIEKLIQGSNIVQTTGLPIGMNVTGYSRKFLSKSLDGIEKKKLETGWGKIFDKNEIELIHLQEFSRVEKIRMTLDYKDDATFFDTVIKNIDVNNISDKILIEKIIQNKWNKINIDLENIYWSNFNSQKEKEN